MAAAPDLSFGLKAMRKESEGAEPEHGIGFEIRRSCQGSRDSGQQGRRECRRRQSRPRRASAAGPASPKGTAAFISASMRSATR